MTIEAWNILLSAVVLVLVSGGGLWLKYVVDQQLKSKDTAIQALEAIIKVKEAQISSLEGNSAPTIVKAYADMREHANLMTEESQRLSSQLADIGRQHRTDKDLLLPKLVLAQVTGLQRATEILENTVWKVLVPDGTVEPKYLGDDFDPLCDSIVAAAEQINVAKRNQLDRGRELLDKIKSPSQ